MHPDFRQKPKPQFEGEVNPETGEVGGPKRDPLAYGEASFLSVNGEEAWPRRQTGGWSWIGEAGAGLTCPCSYR